MKEYKWKFNLEETIADLDNNELSLEFLKSEIKILLQFVIFMREGEEIYIDGFKFVKDRGIEATGIDLFGEKSEGL